MSDILASTLKMHLILKLRFYVAKNNILFSINITDLKITVVQIDAKLMFLQLT